MLFKHNNHRYPYSFNDFVQLFIVVSTYYVLYTVIYTLINNFSKKGFANFILYFYLRHLFVLTISIFDICL